jgi:hypothetical protein
VNPSGADNARCPATQNLAIGHLKPAMPSFLILFLPALLDAAVSVTQLAIQDFLGFTLRVIGS